MHLPHDIYSNTIITVVMKNRFQYLWRYRVNLALCNDFACWVILRTRIANFK